MGAYDQGRGNQADPQRPSGYEPPKVERVLASEDLEREVMYAGPGAGTLPPP